MPQGRQGLRARSVASLQMILILEDLSRPYIRGPVTYSKSAEAARADVC